jgi:hypothetical protein
MGKSVQRVVKARFYWHDPDAPWRRYQIRAPRWFRRIRNRRLRGIQNRETRRDGDVRTPFKQDAAYIYW